MYEHSELVHSSFPKPASSATPVINNKTYIDQQFKGESGAMGLRAPTVEQYPKGTVNGN